MKIDKLSRMIKGWFVGDFEPTVHKTQSFEVGVKNYKKGDKENWHVHKIGAEITLVLDGSAVMCGKTLNDGDIIALDPGEGTAFEALTDCRTVVVKFPSVKGDKYEK